jgi:hypothetical protein
MSSTDFTENPDMTDKRATFVRTHSSTMTHSRCNRRTVSAQVMLGALLERGGNRRTRTNAESHTSAANLNGRAT